MDVTALLDTDTARFTQSLVTFNEMYQVAASNALVVMGVQLTAALVFVYCFVRFKDGVVEFIGKLNAGVMSSWERRTMRKKLREEQADAFVDATIVHIEACVELDPTDQKAMYAAKRRGILPMTRTDANLMYQRLARSYPRFMQAITKFDPKEKAVEAIANADRDAEGNIIPLPIPEPVKEVPTQKTKHVVSEVRRNKVATA